MFTFGKISIFINTEFNLFTKNNELAQKIYYNTTYGVYIIIY